MNSQERALKYSAFYCEHLTVCLYSFSLEYSAAQEKQFQNRLGKKKKKDSPDPGPERVRGKKAKESKNKDLRSSSEFTALLVAAVRVSGEITTYFKRTRKNQEKRSRCVVFTAKGGFGSHLLLVLTMRPAFRVNKRP